MTTGRVIDYLGINDKVKCGFDFKVRRLLYKVKSFQIDILINF